MPPPELIFAVVTSVSPQIIKGPCPAIEGGCGTKRPRVLREKLVGIADQYPVCVGGSKIPELFAGRGFIAPRLSGGQRSLNSDDAWVSLTVFKRAVI